MELDRNGLGILDRHECLEFLRSVPVARIGLAVSGVPVVLPVNFVLDGDAVLFRSGVGSKLDAALSSGVVAVEADDFDVVTRTGWSVVVRGRARELVDDAEIERASRLELEPWVTDQADHFISVSTELVSGRCIGVPRGLPPIADTSGPAAPGP